MIESSLQGRPCERRDPYAAADRKGTEHGSLRRKHVYTRLRRAMGRDDAGGCIEAEPLNQQIGKIAPFEIILLDELNLPIAFPFLQLLLAGDRLNGSFIGLDVDESVYTVLADEFGSTSHPMLLEPETKI